MCPLQCNYSYSASLIAITHMREALRPLSTAHGTAAGCARSHDTTHAPATALSGLLSTAHTWQCMHLRLSSPKLPLHCSPPNYPQHCPPLGAALWLHSSPSITTMQPSSAPPLTVSSDLISPCDVLINNYDLPNPNPKKNLPNPSPNPNPNLHLNPNSNSNPTSSTTPIYL